MHIGAIANRNQLPKKQRNIAEGFGIFSGLIAINAGILFALATQTLLVFPAILIPVWIMVLGVAYGRIKARKPWNTAAITVVLTMIFFAAEFWIMVQLFSASSGDSEGDLGQFLGLLGYVAAIAIVPFVATRYFKRRLEKV
jgi:hypothetical protein